MQDITERMERSPHKPVRQLAAQTAVSKTTCHKALKKKLHMHPYKMTVVQELHPVDFEKRVEFCTWFNENLANNNEILNLTFFSDEAWFHLSGYVNSQNYRTWSTENPHNYIEVPLHSIKIGVWVAMSRRRIVGPYFFEENVTAVKYQELLQQFIDELHDDELTRGYFQQDGATAHTANVTINFLRQYFDNRIVSRRADIAWPPRSPDLSPLDFYLFGYLKNTIYKTRMHTLNELKNAITDAITQIPQEVLGRVSNNMKNRVIKCLDAEGHHFEHIL